MPRQARSLSLLLTAILLAVATGCIPAVWLPDSSGFVYTVVLDGTKGGSRLMHYDVNKKQRRLLVDKMPAATVWPAISPDGKQVAVAALMGGKNKPMQVIIYDLDGKEVRRSPEFAWSAVGVKGEEFLVTGVFWVGDKIIVHDFVDLGGGDGKKKSTTGIYDLMKNTMITVEGRPATFAGTPVRPDGKGFLITKLTPWMEDGKNGLTVGMAVVDWQGKVQPLGTDQVRKAELADDSRGLLSDPWLGTSRWQGNVAEVTACAGRLQIDTANRKVTFTKIPLAKVKGAEIFQQFSFPDSKVQVRVLRSKGKNRLELVKAGEPTLLDESGSASILSPSPNGKWVAIRKIDPGREEPMILLVNSMGEVQRLAALPPRE